MTVIKFPGHNYDTLDKSAEEDAKAIASRLAIIDELRSHVASGHITGFITMALTNEGFTCSAAGNISVVEWMGLAELMKGFCPIEDEDY